MKKITLIIGPTAIGKSNLAIEIARKHEAEIISADAFQVYKYMDIGTAKVPLAIRKEIPHHLIDTKTPDETYSVAEFITLSKDIITKLLKKDKHIIICGGTGFYIKAFLYNYEFVEQSQNNKIRDQLWKKCKKIGPHKMWQELNIIDPESAKLIDPNNEKRIIRALEIYDQTKNPPSQYRKKSQHPRSDVKTICLTAERQWVIERINQRVEDMIQSGLIEEVQHIINLGYSPDSQAFEALGYKETTLYLKGSISKEEMINLIKVKTRQFAKRQMTWFKKLENVQWIDISKISEIL